MKKINLHLTEDIYDEFIGLLDNCVYSEFPSIDSNIAEKILKEILDD